MSDEHGGLSPKAPPDCEVLEGRFIRLERVDAALHSSDFDDHLCGAANVGLWRYIPFGPPENGAKLCAVLSEKADTLGWQSFAIRDVVTGEVTGTVSLMRIRPEHGSAEIGCVVFGKALQRTPAATESVYLLGEYLFDELGYRRYEWKCDAANMASRRAAKRFGFAYEGTFRNDMIVGGRSRDTAWFAMTDDNWTHLKPAYERWLSPDNFEESGAQRVSLSDLTQELASDTAL